jgi:flavin reductase (DIM6/NTAB) family NADH-FMN oxidoreductase RutF
MTSQQLVDLYDELMAVTPSGVQILTLRDESGSPRGMTVSSLTPVVADPPSVLVCIGGEASMRPTLIEGRPVALSFLAPHQTMHSMGFAFGDDDPFEVFAWSEGSNGAPVIDDVAAHLLGDVERVVEHHGTAVTFISLTGGDVCPGTGALVYWQGAYFEDLAPAAEPPA